MAKVFKIQDIIEGLEMAKNIESITKEVSSISFKQNYCTKCELQLQDFQEFKDHCKTSSHVANLTLKGNEHQVEAESNDIISFEEALTIFQLPNGTFKLFKCLLTTNHNCITSICDNMKELLNSTCALFLIRNGYAALCFFETINHNIIKSKCIKRYRIKI